MNAILFQKLRKLTHSPPEWPDPPPPKKNVNDFLFQKLREQILALHGPNTPFKKATC